MLILFLPTENPGDSGSANGCVEMWNGRGSVTAAADQPPQRPGDTVWAPGGAGCHRRRTQLVPACGGRPAKRPRLSSPRPAASAPPGPQDGAAGTPAAAAGPPTPPPDSEAARSCQLAS